MTPPSFRAASAYSNVGVQTRSTEHDQHHLVAMMFEGVLNCITAARGAIRAKDLGAKHKAIDKAIRILQVGLRTALDLENGGQLAANLAALYDYSVVRLTLANSKNDESVLEEVANLIKPVAEGWNQIRHGSPATPVAPEQPQAARASVEQTPAPAVVPMPMRRINSLYGAAPLGGKVSVGV